MNFLKGLLCLLILNFYACSTPVLRDDIGGDGKGYDAFNANYPSAELYVKGKLFNGLAFAYLPAGQPLSSLKFGIQAYFNGTMRIVSNSQCPNRIDITVNYSDNAYLEPSLPGVASKDCLFEVVVSPTLPEGTHATFPVRSFKGVLVVTPVAEQSVITKVEQGRDATAEFPVNVPDGSQVQFAFVNDNCGVRKSLNITAAVGLAKVNATQLFNDGKVPVTSCPIAYGYKAGNVVTKGTWLLWGYKAGFMALPEPVITLEDGKFAFQTTRNVTVVSVDSKTELVDDDGRAKVEGDPSRPHLFRLLTVGGRSTFGLYVPGTPTLWLK